MIRNVDDNGVHYDAIMFWCPGCEKLDNDGKPYGGLNMLPVTPPRNGPMWTFDGNIESPTLGPSILTHYDDQRGKFVCHSFLRNGVFEFLGDCTHALAGQNVPMPDLPDWCIS